MSQNDPLNPLISPEFKAHAEMLLEDKHPGSICVANYKGGVGKTSLVCLLGYYLHRLSKEKVLLIDIDPQCSLSLALGFDPDAVSKKEHTIYNLVKPTKWTKIRRTNFESYITKCNDESIPEGLDIILGSYAVEDLDMEIVKSTYDDKSKTIDQLFLYAKQMLNGFSDYKYVLIDCPPNKMFVTQALLRACSFYLPVTIPDAISIYGMPRLLQWVKKIDDVDRPYMLGYILNAVNRAGGKGMVTSQENASSRLENLIKSELNKTETKLIGKSPVAGIVPRLDVVARFLEGRNKFFRTDLEKRTSGQPSVDECMTGITEELIRRMDTYNAQERDNS